LLIGRQATLFVPPPFDISIEAVRAHNNPLQFGLIRAHLTLCREDKVADWDIFSEVLNGQNRSIRKHNPHIALVHPRNGICTVLMFGEICRELSLFSVAFRSVTLIGQVDGRVWTDLRTFS